MEEFDERRPHGSKSGAELQRNDLGRIEETLGAVSWVCLPGDLFFNVPTGQFPFFLKG